jgi:hypothetical protein
MAMLTELVAIPFATIVMGTAGPVGVFGGIVTFS